MPEERSPRSQKTLSKASCHVHYERKMLQYCGDILVKHPSFDGNEYAAIMDSFLIHARNLNHFLYGPGTVRPDDVIAEDFFPSAAPWQKPMDGQLTKKEINDINWQLAHLSYRRTQKQRDSYPYQDIQDRLLGTIEQFVKDAPADNLCQELLNDWPIFRYLGMR